MFVFALIFGIVVSISYVVNIVKIFTRQGKEPTVYVVARFVGIFIPIFGGVMGLLKGEKKNETV